MDSHNGSTEQSEVDWGKIVVIAVCTYRLLRTYYKSAHMHAIVRYIDIELYLIDITVSQFLS